MTDLPWPSPPTPRFREVFPRLFCLATHTGIPTQATWPPREGCNTFMWQNKKPAQKEKLSARRVLGAQISRCRVLLPKGGASEPLGTLPRPLPGREAETLLPGPLSLMELSTLRGLRRLLQTQHLCTGLRRLVPRNEEKLAGATF